MVTKIPGWQTGIGWESGKKWPEADPYTGVENSSGIYTEGVI